MHAVDTDVVADEAHKTEEKPAEEPATEPDKEVEEKPEEKRCTRLGEGSRRGMLAPPEAWTALGGFADVGLAGTLLAGPAWRRCRREPPRWGGGGRGGGGPARAPAPPGDGRGAGGGKGGDPGGAGILKKKNNQQ